MMRKRWLVVVPALAAMACGDDAGRGTGPGAVLRLEVPKKRLVEGQSLTLHASAGGRALDGDAVTWESRDRSTLTVHDGVVRAVAPGVTWVVARSGSAADSVRLTAHFAQVAGQSVAIRVAGQDAQGVRLSGQSQILRGLTNGVEFTNIWANNSRGTDPTTGSLQWGDSLIMIALPGRATTGVKQVKPYTNLRIENGNLRWDNPDGSGVIFQIHDPVGRRDRLYFAVNESQLEITTADIPATPGTEPGTLGGAIAFEAAGFYVDRAADGSQSLTAMADTTVHVYAEFSAPLAYHLVAPQVVEMKGLLAGRPDSIEARIDNIGHAAGGGVVFYTNRLLFPGDLTRESIFVLRMWIPHPAVGTTSFAPASAALIADTVAAAHPGVPAILGPDAWTYAGVAKFSRLVPYTPSGNPGPWEFALGRGGSYTITEYRAPTQTGYGYLKGRLDLDLEYWHDGFTGDRLHLTGAAREDGRGNTTRLDFNIPIAPLGT